MVAAKNNIISEPAPFWLPLDNAAKIFPSVRSRKHTTVLRISAILTERIALKPLMEAVSLAGMRFPYYKVCLRHGFFWHYLEESPEPIGIVPDSGRPCIAFDRHDKNTPLVRVLVLRNRLSVEFFHILTDGHGVSRFLIWLLEKYFSLKESHLEEDVNINTDMLQEEMEDAYLKYFKNNVPAVSRQSKAYHLPFRLNKKSWFDVLVAIMPVNEIKERAAGKGVSITVYLVAVYLFVLQEIMNEDRRQKKRVLRIQVPVNLRNIYHSNTMRNFSLFVMPEIDPRLGRYSFDEIIKVVHHKMKLETDEKLISRIISRNVGSEKNPLVRGIPLVLKNIVLRSKYYTQGSNQYSGVVTNLGKLQVPMTIQDKIDYFVLTPPPPNKKIKINCGIIGHKDKLVLSFGNITESKELEKRFLRFLSKKGVGIKIKKLMGL